MRSEIYIQKSVDLIDRDPRFGVLALDIAADVAALSDVRANADAMANLLLDRLWCWALGRGHLDGLVTLDARTLAAITRYRGDAETLWRVMHSADWLRPTDESGVYYLVGFRDRYTRLAERRKVSAASSQKLRDRLKHDADKAAERRARDNARKKARRDAARQSASGVSAEKSAVSASDTPKSGGRGRGHLERKAAVPPPEVQNSQDLSVTVTTAQREKLEVRYDLINQSDHMPVSPKSAPPSPPATESALDAPPSHQPSATPLMIDDKDSKNAHELVAAVASEPSLEAAPRPMPPVSRTAVAASWLDSPTLRALAAGTVKPKPDGVQPADTATPAARPAAPATASEPGLEVAQRPATPGKAATRRSGEPTPWDKYMPEAADSAAAIARRVADGAAFPRRADGDDAQGRSVAQGTSSMAARDAKASTAPAQGPRQAPGPMGTVADGMKLPPPRAGIWLPDNLATVANAEQLRTYRRQAGWRETSKGNNHVVAAVTARITYRELELGRAWFIERQANDLTWRGHSANLGHLVAVVTDTWRKPPAARSKLADAAVPADVRAKIDSAGLERFGQPCQPWLIRELHNLELTRDGTWSIERVIRNIEMSESWEAVASRCGIAYRRPAKRAERPAGMSGAAATLGAMLPQLAGRQAAGA